MTMAMTKCTLYLLCSLLVAVPVIAQAGAPAAPTPSPAAAPTGTYSIEAEMLAYRSLHANSSAIANDVTDALNATKPGVLVVPSVSAILPEFQQWRVNMAIINNLVAQYNQSGFGPASCPVDRLHAHAPSFSDYTAAVTEGVGALQSILSLFANTQAVAEFSGTIQDQALITAVARGLRTRGFEILVPDVYTSWTIADIDAGKFPFLGKLADLIAKHGTLQGIYQCNTLAVSAGSQLQQAEVTREADYTKLAALDLTKKDTNPQPIANDIASMKVQINVLRGKIGIDITQPNIQNPESTITAQGRTLLDPKSTTAQKDTALQSIRDADASVAGIENPILRQAALMAAQAQGLAAGIEAYLAGLTGGAVSLSSPPATSAPGTASAAAPATGGSAAPPILTILQMDGLARRMGLPDTGDWRILWLKAMESGGAIITRTNIFGSHPYFGGGAVSGYALFSLDGSLVCSGNVAAYGGYFKAKDFTKHGGIAGGTPPALMLNLEGGCSTSTPANEKDEVEKKE